MVGTRECLSNTEADRAFSPTENATRTLWILQTQRQSRQRQGQRVIYQSGLPTRPGKPMLVANCQIGSRSRLTPPIPSTTLLSTAI